MKPKLIALEIPEDAAALAGWLDRHVAGMTLGALVAELDAVHGPTSAPSSLDQALGRARDAVLAGGLAMLPLEQLRLLLRQPRLLLDLQELVLTDGGRYWRELARESAEVRLGVERGRASVRASLGEDGADVMIPKPPLFSTPRPWRRRVAWAASLATAAAVLLCVLVVAQSRWRGQPAGADLAATAWGWNKPGALPQDMPPGAYLDHLADAAQEWSRKHPEKPLELARRIAEFRQGCSVLILSPHRPLSDDDRAWLIGKCRAWAARLDAHLAAIEAGEDPLRVRDQVDATVANLVKALRDRARETLPRA